MNITQEQLESYVSELGFTCLNLPTEFMRRRLTVKWPAFSGEVEASFLFDDITFLRYFAYHKTPNSLTQIRFD